MLKKAILAASLAAMMGSAFANDLCTEMNNVGGGNGAWKGSYLMKSQTYPIRMYLNYQNGMVYGYTLPSKDSSGYGFGTGNKQTGTGHYYVWANCSNSTLTNLHFTNAAGSCGGVYANAQAVHIGVDNPLVLVLPFNGATSTLTATFMPQSEAISVNSGLLNSVIAAAKANNTNLSACQ